jgi:hypothetical protein
VAQSDVPGFRSWPTMMVTASPSAAQYTRAPADPPYCRHRVAGRPASRIEPGSAGSSAVARKLNSHVGVVHHVSGGTRLDTVSSGQVVGASRPRFTVGRDRPGPGSGREEA